MHTVRLEDANGEDLGLSGCNGGVITSVLLQVKIHYTVEGDTSVISTISANVATIDFIMKGLPGQPES